MREAIVGVVWVVIVVFGISEAHGVNIWPMPKWVNNGNGTMILSPDFELVLLNNYDDSSSILRQGFNRMLDVVTLGHVLRSNFSSPFLLKGLQVLVSSSDHQVRFLCILCLFFFHFIYKNVESVKNKKIQNTTRMGYELSGCIAVGFVVGDE